MIEEMAANRNVWHMMTKADPLLDGGGEKGDTSDNATLRATRNDSRKKPNVFGQNKVSWILGWKTPF